jgi:uncharacterized protein (DUF3084 family)
MIWGYVLAFLATVVLGGVIATVGDRLGSKVGKARLRLFNLRPRQTATIITIITGSLISTLTLGLIFLAGVLELEQVQTRLNRAREELDTARIEQDLARNRLQQINESLQSAIARQQATQRRLDRSQTQLQRVEQRFKQANDRYQQVSRQARVLQTTIQRLQQEQQQLASQLDRLQWERQQLAQRNQTLLQQNQDRAAQIQAREQQLRALEGSLAQVNRQFQEAQEVLGTLELEVARLEREAQDLREGSVALRRGQVLASAVASVTNPNQVRPAIDELLREANREALRLTQPGLDAKQVIAIPSAEIEQVRQTLQDGREYYLQVLSTANYVLGEEPVRVVIDVVLNQLVFRRGEVIAATLFEPVTMDQAEIRERLELLIDQAQFRGQRSGVVSGTRRIEDIEGLIRFVLWLERQTVPVEVRAVAVRDIYSAGPLSLSFVALINGEVRYRMDGGPVLDPDGENPNASPNSRNPGRRSPS